MKITAKRVLAGLLTVLLVLFCFTGCKKDDDLEKIDYTYTPIEKDEPVAVVEEPERSYSVSSSSDIATSVAMNVLKSGGNAVDAAVALSYTLGVVEHYASGIGGSGGLLVYDTNTGECVFYDYRAQSGSNGYSSIGIPGFVKGMEEVHNDYGSLKMADLLEPAIDYAENGFKVNSVLSNRIAGLGSAYSDFVNNNGNTLSAGETLVQSKLAETLRAIQSDGADVFYNGYIAQDIANATNLSLDNLSSYSVYKNKAVEGSYEGYTVYGSCVPLSGVLLIQMLEMAEALDIPDPNEDISGYLSDLRKITAAAYSDRYYTIGDSTFYDDGVDIDAYQQSLISHDYINYLLGITDTSAESYDDESPETTSYSIVDSNGLVVVATNTLSSFWGSGVMVDGFFLNNTNYNFSSDGVNRYQSNKRSRTFTAPTIVTGEDGYVIAIGSPGGNNIPSVLFNAIVDLIRFEEDPQTAVTKSRFLYRGGLLTIELDKEGNTWLNTSSIGETVIWRDTGFWWGSISLAGYSDEDGAFAAYDYRRGATAAGVYNP